MYKLCKSEQSAARQRKLEEGLLSAMLTVCYNDINVSDLCQRMGIPRKSFYRYFSGKDGALHALIDHTLMEFETYTSQRGRQIRFINGELEQFFLFWFSHKQLLDALERSGLSGVLIERAIEHAISETVFPGRFLCAETREVQNQVVTFAVCGLMTMVVQWHHRGYLESAQSLAEIAVRLLTQPLFPKALDLL